jgi:hypothetical protein
MERGDRRRVDGRGTLRIELAIDRIVEARGDHGVCVRQPRNVAKRRFDDGTVFCGASL